MFEHRGKNDAALAAIMRCAMQAGEGEELSELYTNVSKLIVPQLLSGRDQSTRMVTLWLTEPDGKANLLSNGFREVMQETTLRQTEDTCTLRFSPILDTDLTRVEVYDNEREKVVLIFIFDPWYMGGGFWDVDRYMPPLTCPQAAMAW